MIRPADEPTYEPAWRATVPDWLLVMRATWATPKLMAEAAAEIQRRNAEPARNSWPFPGKPKIELSADADRHQAILDAALVAEETVQTHRRVA